MVGGLPAGAGGAGSGPGLGGSRVPRSGLGPWATVAGPARLEPVVRGGWGRGGGGPTHHGGVWPPLSAAGGALAQRRGPGTAINK